jgi:hypothetical protein
MKEAGVLPVGSSAAVLLDFLRIDAFEATLGKELGNYILGQDGAVGNASVVSVIDLVRASHWLRCGISNGMQSGCKRVKGVTTPS